MRGHDMLCDAIGTHTTLSDLLLQVRDPHVVRDEHVGEGGDADETAERGSPEPSLGADSTACAGLLLRRALRGFRGAGDQLRVRCLASTLKLIHLDL